MRDQVIKGTGDSRYLRSSIPSSTTFAQFLTMLRNGELPVDFAGYNAEGIDTVGTDLNTANLLSDTVAVELGLTNAATPNDAFQALNNKANSIQSSMSGYVPTSRTVNNKRLDANITISKSDVGLNKVVNKTLTMSLDQSHTVLTISYE